MSVKTYQVTLDENGEATGAIRLPDEPAKKRSLIVRETSEKRAKRAAEALFSLAK